MTRMRCDRTPAWTALRALYETQGRSLDLRQAFAADEGRFERLSLQAPHVFADLSKNLIQAAIQAQLTELARQCGTEQHREAMFRGEPVNSTEDRAAMHFLLRHPGGATAPQLTPYVQGELSEVHQVLNAMLAYAQAVREDAAITDVVNIGIGGSDLGPQMAVLALDEFVDHGKRYHFVSSVDGHELSGVLRQVRPESTLFLVASKSFTTLETMTNARSAKAWFEAQGGRNIARHFCALTSNVQAAAEFGISTTFGFWDWVGGRYSMWSAIGLPIAIAIGPQRFRELLAGAHAMDEHFRTAALEHNLPVQLALLDVWYRNFHGFGSRSVAPYHSGLRRMQAYLQQLEMESNGKRVDETGQALPYATSAVIWGEPAANGQHAYFQMLHQGSDVIPVEFIAVKKVAHDLSEHHHKLLANGLAQAQALMLGQQDAGGHRHMPGNRPSTFLVLEELTPASLGALISLYEHRVFVAGSLWGINSFDQWGVELGKVLAQAIEPRLASGDTTGLDASTAGLLKRLRS
ncbi:glucose-6-phosphate isomerase [Rhodoferax sp. BAB1]|uniref:glucose-6-phosphate isomerase n=1 Tax=Rhodoferax sp. BAB1 TaxID=2741720 RepID=UPI001576FA23|nr:glucose-6-phosphate isomerase [Rhodoferax sp. BAB1]QKO22867.1 glucose-6-phosphate isomerase [Rhodoferax sp. BAB1]